jgi:hypothetical protein
MGHATQCQYSGTRRFPLHSLLLEFLRSLWLCGHGGLLFEEEHYERQAAKVLRRSMHRMTTLTPVMAHGPFFNPQRQAVHLQKSLDRRALLQKPAAVSSAKSAVPHVPILIVRLAIQTWHFAM